MCVCVCVWNQWLSWFGSKVKWGVGSLFLVRPRHHHPSMNARNHSKSVIKTARACRTVTRWTEPAGTLPLYHAPRFSTPDGAQERWHRHAREEAPVRDRSCACRALTSGGKDEKMQGRDRRLEAEGESTLKNKNSHDGYKWFILTRARSRTLTEEGAGDGQGQGPRRVN